MAVLGINNPLAIKSSTAYPTVATASAPKTSSVKTSAIPTGGTAGHDMPWGPNGEVYNSDGSVYGLIDNIQPSVDPYAKYGGAGAYNSMVSGYDTQKQNLLSSYGDAIAGAGTSIKNNILDFVDNLTSRQRGVDNSRTQNELSRTIASKDILDSVGNGIRSSGVVLANRNAGSSSAAGQLAAAQAQLGRKSMSKVGNQYEANNSTIGQQQQDLDTFKNSNVRKLGDDKTTVINGIVSDAQQKLAALDAQIASADLPNRINIEAEKEGIRQRALQELQQYDSLLASGVGGVKAMGTDTAREKAYQMANAGTAPESSFQYTTDTPVQLQGTGPFSSDLPLFTYRGNKQQYA